MSLRAKKFYLGLLLTLLAALLLFPKLGAVCFWEDEGETALIARNYLHFGYMTPWDGRHLVTQQAGRDAYYLHGKLVWVWHPWLQHYLCAAGFALLGENTFAGRFFFALLALLTVPFFFWWRLHRSEGRLLPAAISTLIYLGSMTFLLYSRQCRYYPILFAGGLLASASFLPLLEGGARRWCYVLGTGAGLALVFYGNPLGGVAMAAGFTCYALVMQEKPAGLGKALVLILALMGLLCLPWGLLMIMAHVKAEGITFQRRVALVFTSAWRYQYTLLPVVTWPVLAWYWFKQRKVSQWAKSNRELALLAVASAVAWLVLAAFTPRRAVEYLLCLWPLCASALGTLWERLDVRRPLLAAGFLGALLCSNLITVLPELPFALVPPPSNSTELNFVLLRLSQLSRPRLLLFDFVRSELVAPTPGPVANLIHVVKGFARKPNYLYTDYAWEPLYFYLDVPVIMHAGEAEARQRLNLPPPPDPRQADLVCPRHGRGPLLFEPDKDPDRVVLPVAAPDYMYENLPVLTNHRWGNTEEAPPLVIYARKEFLASQPKAAR